MFLRGLKINIVFHLVVLTALGMIMINLVMLTAFQRVLVNMKVSHGNTVASAIKPYVMQYQNMAGEDQFTDVFFKQIETITLNSDYSESIIMDYNSDVIYKNNISDGHNKLLNELLRQAINAEEKRIKFNGQIWAVFWKAEEYLFLALPLFEEQEVIGGLGLVFQLKGIYALLRHLQHPLWVYIFANVIVLTIIGFYQLSKITVKPFNRLLKRAEEYKEQEDVFFKPDNKDNEFQKLSFALNRMLMRISRDKEDLQTTIQSLEKSNSELKEAQREVIRSEKLATVGRLFSGIAHEIGNPISIILGYFELLKQGTIDKKEQKDIILRAEKETKRINTIIRGMLSFSRPAGEKLEMISVHKTIQSFEDIVKHQPFMTNINLELDLAASKDTVLGNPNSMQQILLNMLMNAADAIMSGPNAVNGKIKIQTEDTSHLSERPGNKVPSIIIRIIDNGTGISKENLENLFDPFFTTKDPGKGTGLGLFVSFKIVEGMGGKIKALSETNNGTTMAVTLPLIQNNMEADHGGLQKKTKHR